MKEYLIFGGSGLIGRSLLSFLKNKKLSYLATNTKGSDGLIKFNLGNPEEIENYKLETIKTAIITAAISSPDICNKEFDYAWSINVEGTARLIKYLINKKIKIIFLSSDTVYGQQKEPFNESLKVNPLGKYALMKNYIENLFYGNSFFKSVRLSYVFAKNDSFTSYLLDCFRKDIEAEIFHPFYRSIIHLDDVIEGLIVLSKSWHQIDSNIINFGGPNQLSRLEFASKLNKYVFKKLRYTKIEPEKSFFVNRPKIISMRSPILKKMLQREITNLDEAIKKEFKNF